MNYVKDWEKSKQRFEAMWQGELLDRCCVSIRAPRDGAKPLPPLVEDEAYYTDPEAIIRRSRAAMEATYYCGDAFPCMSLYTGASGHAGYFKGERHFIRDTVWFLPSLNNLDELEFDPDSKLYRNTIELAHAAAEDSRGDYFISMPDTTGNADALSHLMGQEAVLTAMIDDPEGVQRALDKVELAYESIMRDVYDIIGPVNEGGGCIGWLNTWAPGFHAQMQCDMSVMISNKMYNTFIRPELVRQSSLLDNALYHFDGIEQRRHLDTLLSIPSVRAIQWTQVVGQPPCTDYFDDLRRIQQAGKCLVIAVESAQLESVMRELSSHGLYLLLFAASQSEADELLKKVEKWTHE